MRIFCMIIFQNTVNDLTVHRASKEEQVDYVAVIGNVILL